MRKMTFLLTSLLAFQVHVYASDAIVDASKFATLQVAADAIPDTGGVLQIPPGTHEITEPLRIKTGDTHVVGYDAASHIVNRNVEGKPLQRRKNNPSKRRKTPTKPRKSCLRVVEAQ